MRRNTRKYSGPALERYLRRFFADEPGLPPETVEQLAARGGAAFSSLRVRAQPLAIPGPRDGAISGATHATAAPARGSAALPPEPGSAEFDPYSIGLVPTFQREGRDGLIARLGAITSPDHLRQMARTQQIVLPEALRQGDAAAEVLRLAIADAVARRIADRKAAAG